MTVAIVAIECDEVDTDRLRIYINQALGVEASTITGISSEKMISCLVMAV